MNCTIRPLRDIDVLMTWRAEVIRAVFGVEPSQNLLAANRSYYATHIADGTHIAVIARTDDADAGCGSVCLSAELPSPDNPSGRCAYLMNIYVRPPYRSQGIGHAIVHRLVEMAQNLGCGKIFLETTSEARTLYKSIGFTDLPGIMKYEEVQHP